MLNESEDRPDAPRPNPPVLTPPPDADAEFDAVEMDRLRARFAPPRESGELGRLGHYRILAVLGAGGMGAVFRGEDTQLLRPVALKMMLPSWGAKPVARDRFLREARAAANIRSDHVVTIYQVGEENDVPFIAMELLRGRSLQQHLDQHVRFPMREVARIGREIATGLAAAHELGLIHRDIKPSNVWLEEPTGRVKILDFGLVRQVNQKLGLTRAGTMVGTPEFMSPEQARGEPLDARSDLFSLGAVLYYTATEHLPFAGETLSAVLTALATERPRHVRELRHDTPMALATLIMRLLDKDTRRRPGSAAEVAETLASIEAALPPPSKPMFRAATPTPVSPPSTTWSSLTRRAALSAGVLGVVGGLSWLGYREWTSRQRAGAAGLTGPPIKIGILHSRTGTMAISERPVIAVAELAVAELNAQGGVLGRPVVAIVEDGQSDENVFAKKAEKLIVEDRVRTIFGCWTSASRKAVRAVIEKHDHLLVYCNQFEGMETSRAVFYAGAAPNQQILPALAWAVGSLARKRWFLIGSDYVFPRAANAVIRDEAHVRKADIVGEEYLLLGDTEVSGVIAKIREANPTLVLNTLNGDSNVAFFRALRRAGLSSQRLPTLSFSISEAELIALTPQEREGDYIATNYFPSIRGAANETFLRSVRTVLDEDQTVSDPMQKTYVLIHLWAEAVRAARSDDVRMIRQALRGLTADAPQGAIRVDPETQYLHQHARIGKFDASGRLQEEYVSSNVLKPEPFPTSRTQNDWTAFLDDLYQGWGKRWANPGF